MFAFDLDGTLIDSEDLIRSAYQEAGVSPPSNFMKLGHHDWVHGCLECRAAVHVRKNAGYLERLASSPLKLLPPWYVAVRLHERGDVVALLTGAPRGAAEVFAGRVPVWPFSAAQDALTPTSKATWLQGAGTGVYVDDQRYVTMPPGWRLVQYTGQDADELWKQVA